ncbi:hypothetical protein DFH06DRAFT_1404514 [Mycena polygramma]|nr:hypothetical protein DFH06DRAFT_1404514 [Mycena polygramma]
MNILQRQTAAASSSPPSSSFAASAGQSSISQVIRASVADASNSSAIPASNSLSASGSAAPSSSAPPHSDVSASASASAPQSASQSASQSHTPSDTPSASSSAPPSSASASASQTPSSAAPSSSAPVSSAPPSTSVVQASDSSTTDFVSASASASFTTLVTNVTSALPPPTSLSNPGSSPSTAQRTAIIAGATAAGVALVLLLLGGVFVYKRHKSRKREFSEAIGRVRREAHGAGGVGLLDEEGFDDEDVPMRRYQDNAVTHSRSASSLGPPQSPAPSLFRQRAETGSLFREEGVWPPPQGTHVDPLVGVGTGDGLGKIVDEIMGPSPTARKDDATRGNIPSMSSASSSSLYADPFRDISHVPAPSDPSLYFDRRGASSSSAASAHSQQTSGSRPTTPQSLLGLPAGAATPKKPSPLAASAVPSTAAAPPTSATWLTRSPRKHTRGLSGSQSSHEA